MATDHKEETPVIVIMVPYSLQSHLNQFLQLSHLIISSYNIPVHYVGSAFHNSQVRSRSTSHGLSSLELSKIQFHDFPIPPYGISNNNIDSNSSSDPSFSICFHVTMHLRQPFFALLQLLSSKAKRIIIIHDALAASVVQDSISVHNSESYVFYCVSSFYIFSIIWEAMGKPSHFADGDEISINNIPRHHELPSLEDCQTPEFKRMKDYQFQFLGSVVGELYNTTRSIEGPYVDLLAKKEKINKMNGKGKKIWAIGPLNPITLIMEKRSNLIGNQEKCLMWLDRQKPNSVLYVCFGTTTSMADQQIKEVALGLEQSGVKFLWVLRDADKGDFNRVSVEEEEKEEELPEGFKERIEEEGMGLMVVRDWAPQPHILGHPSTEGFMSHCGWNSCMESISFGVPIAAWPMQLDQPRNAVLITQILKVGVNVRDWGQNKNQLVRSWTISKAVRILMASDVGNEMRKRAADLGDAVRESIAQGGISRMEWDSFINHIIRS